MHAYTFTCEIDGYEKDGPMYLIVRAHNFSQAYNLVYHYLSDFEFADTNITEIYP